MWRPRDRERFIGGYDPEHEMPDPDRDRGDRWQSGAYRHNARDSRFAYRWDPDRFEGRFADRDRGMDPRWERDARDRQFNGGYGGGYDRDFDRDRGEYSYGPDRGYDRGFDRGYDYDRGWRTEDRGPRDDWYDNDRAREFGGRGYERDWRDRQRFDYYNNDRDRDRGVYRPDRGYGPDDYDRDPWRNRR